MNKLYNKCNHRYDYNHYASEKYMHAMSWKGTILCVLCFIFSRFLWGTVLDLNEEHYAALAAVSLFYFIDSLYIDYIFCKYTYLGKYKNIDQQARAGDWLSCFYAADSVLVLIGSLFAIFIFFTYWYLWMVKICFLLLLGFSFIMVLPIFRVTARKTTLLWSILWVIIYGTVQRTGYLITFSQVFMTDPYLL